MHKTSSFNNSILQTVFKLVLHDIFELYKCIFLLQLLFPDICIVILMLFDEIHDFEVCGLFYIKTTTEYKAVYTNRFPCTETVFHQVESMLTSCSDKKYIQKCALLYLTYVN